MDDPFAILRALSKQIAEDLVESGKQACKTQPPDIKNVLPEDAISTIVSKLTNNQGKYVKFRTVPLAFKAFNASPGFLHLQKRTVDKILQDGIDKMSFNSLMDSICAPLVMYVAKFTSDGMTYLIVKQDDPTDDEHRKILTDKGTVLGELGDEKFKTLFDKVKAAEAAAKLAEEDLSRAKTALRKLHDDCKVLGPNNEPIIPHEQCTSDTEELRKKIKGIEEFLSISSAPEVSVPIASLPDHEINAIMLARLTAAVQSMITFYVDNDFDYLNRTFELKGKSAGGRKQKSRRGHKQKSRRVHKTRRGHKTRRHRHRRSTRKH